MRQRHRRPNHRGLPLGVAGALLLLSAWAGPAPAAADVVDNPVTIMGAGDIASSAADATATGDLIRAANPNAVFTVGDNAYPVGSASDYATKYDPAWGSFKDRTHPIPGNHDYQTSGATGYRDYFVAANVTNNVDGGMYYAWDVGNGWRAYAVNTEIPSSDAQLTWLRNDVAAHPAQHYILYTHHPRFTSGSHHASTAVCPLWNALAATGGLAIVVAGHNHQYERFTPMDCTGRVSSDGAMSFVVGSGGAETYPFRGVQQRSEFRNSTDLGVLKLVLHTSSFEWFFIASGRGPGATSTPGQVLDSGAQATRAAP